MLGLQEKLQDYQLELIFVDDGSTDNSYKLLVKHYELNRNKIKIVKFTRNFGQNAAIQAGLKMTDCDCAGIISADLQDPPELFIEMIRKWENGIPLVIAERQNIKRGAKRSLLSKLYWKMVGKYAVKNFPEGGFDFCLIDKNIISDINKIHEKNTHIFVLIFTLGYKYEIIPYTRRERTLGKSQWTFSKKVKLFVDTFISFSYLPVRIITFTGFSIFFLSFLFTLLIVFLKLFYRYEYQGWTSTVVLITFFGGLTLLSLGIIGEYLWRILDEIRKRPIYVIEKVHENKKENQNDTMH